MAIIFTLMRHLRKVNTSDPLASTNMITYMSVNRMSWWMCHSCILPKKWSRISLNSVRMDLVMVHSYILTFNKYWTSLRPFHVIHGNMICFKLSQRYVTWYKVMYNTRAIWRVSQRKALNRRCPSRMKSLHFSFML